MIKYTIHKKLNKTGKRNVFYGTINGKRISSTNFARKWEAERQMINFIKHNDEQKILDWSQR